MKKDHIILVIVLAVAVAILVGSFSNSGTTGNFADAKANPDAQIKISGTLNTSSAIVYEPEVNPNLTIFEMIDKKGNKNIVHLLDSKPQGLEQSEDITLHGKMDGEVFTATDMQMKCPSKYNENKHDIQEIAQN